MSISQSVYTLFIFFKNQSTVVGFFFFIFRYISKVYLNTASTTDYTVRFLLVLPW